MKLSTRFATVFDSVRFATLVLAATALFACGAKTGLDIPDVETGVDAGDAFDAPDVRDVPDVPIVPRVVRCYPVRVHTRIGVVVSIRPDTDSDAASGVEWTIDAQPPGPNRTSTILSDGSLLAAITPLNVGEYDITATIPAPLADGGRLGCSIVVIADPPDPECPDYAITEPRSVEIPGGMSQVAYDIVFHDPRTASSPTGEVISADDPGARVATAAIEHAPAEAITDANTALAREAEAAENQIVSALGATQVLLGRTATTHDQHPIRRSTLRVDGSNTTPGALRDRAVQTILGVMPPADPNAEVPAAQFYVEVVTIIRQDISRVLTLIAVSPVASFDDPTTATAIRVNDFANGTAVARTGAMLQVRCHAVTATRSVQADFLWLVDTSASMNDDQERVGNTAERFFSDLRSAGVDFRVGVFQAGHSRPILEGPPAFRWISGTDVNGAQQMAFEVTEQRYRSNTADNQEPFRMSGSDEEPIAAAVEAIKEFERRRAIGETNPDFVLRPNAAVVTFFVTDEPGTNDYNRYFDMNPAMWGSTDDQLVNNITMFFTSRNIVPFGLVPSIERSPCPSIPNLCRCVITRGSGAFIPINVADSVAQAQLDAAMVRIVDTVAGAASEFVLPVDPISASLRARVDRQLVPRSRSDGFDYEERSRALVFRGATYRPAMGQEVRTAYFVWCDGATPGGCR
jgi:hypothetical protein